MRVNILKPVFFALAILFTTSSYAQERIIHGMVHTFDSIPLVGATVLAKATKQKVLTDTLGNFSIACNENEKLKVTANGFYNENVKISGDIKLVMVNLKLKPGEKARQYAVGYGHVLNEERLNAVANLNRSDVDFSMYSSMYDLIEGRIAGVQVVNGEIIIRGVNSINSSSAALIVVDGVPSDKSILTSISPIQVKNISVIKDGSSAIYGARGANGVVLIETKKGGDSVY